MPADDSDRCLSVLDSLRPHVTPVPSSSISINLKTPGQALGGPSPSTIKVSDFSLGHGLTNPDKTRLDWMQTEGIWRIPPESLRIRILTRSVDREYALYTTQGNLLPCKLTVNLPCPTPLIPRTHVSNVLQTVQRCGFSITEWPMARMHAPNTLDGLVIYLGYTDISTLYNAFLLKQASVDIPVGIMACLIFGSLPNESFHSPDPPTPRQLSLIQSATPGFSHQHSSNFLSLANPG